MIVIAVIEHALWLVECIFLSIMLEFRDDTRSFEFIIQDNNTVIACVSNINVTITPHIDILRRR
ncbi:hypothetical protein D3C71_2021430 [compost metagenome]